MMAQDAPKTHKNAKERRAKKKTEGGSTVEETSGARVRRGDVPVVAAPKRSFPDNVRFYLKGVAAETRRVSWPGKPQVIAGTMTTLFILIVFSVYLGGMDWMLNGITVRLGL